MDQNPPVASCCPQGSTEALPWATVFPTMSRARPIPLIVSPALPAHVCSRVNIPGYLYLEFSSDFHLAFSITSFRLCLINHFKIEMSFWHCYAKESFSFYLYVLYFLSTFIVTCHVIIMPLFISTRIWVLQAP